MTDTNLPPYSSIDIDFDYYGAIFGEEANGRTVRDCEAYTASEIKGKYRELAKTYHPDRNQGDKAAEERLKEINVAYDTLGDEDKRARYHRVMEAYFRWGPDYYLDRLEKGHDPYAKKATRFDTQAYKDDKHAAAAAARYAKVDPATVWPGNEAERPIPADPNLFADMMDNAPAHNDGAERQHSGGLSGLFSKAVAGRAAAFFLAAFVGWTAVSKGYDYVHAPSFPNTESTDAERSSRADVHTEADADAEHAIVQAEILEMPRRERQAAVETVGEKVNAAITQPSSLVRQAKAAPTAFSTNIEITGSVQIASLNDAGMIYDIAKHIRSPEHLGYTVRLEPSTAQGYTRVIVDGVSAAEACTILDNLTKFYGHNFARKEVLPVGGAGVHSCAPDHVPG